MLNKQMQEILYTWHRSTSISLLLMPAVGLAALAVLSCTADVPPLSRDVERLVTDQIASLIKSDFPDLGGLRFEYVPVTENQDAVYFETYVKATSVLRGPKRRTYQIFANERLANHRPDDRAIRAILAHELFHIRDYLEKNIWQLYRLKKDYEKIGFRQQYERFTDQRTLALGYGPGLIRYRKWLYRVIADPKKVEEKKRVYMTPEEINAWLSRRRRPHFSDKDKKGPP